MRTSVTVMVMLALAAFTTLAVPAHAVHDGVTFTEVISDSEGDDDLGLGGFYDILSVSLGVTDDGDIVVRTETKSADSQDDARSSIQVSFTANAADYKLVFKPDGTHLSSSHAAFSETDCEVVDSTYYCLGAVGPDTITLADGDDIEDIKAISKLITDGTGDSAETDDAYTYTAGATGPTVEELTEDEPTISSSVDASTNETVVYTWNNTLGGIEVTYAFNITNGSVQVDATTNGTSLFDQTFDASTEGTLPLKDAPEGAYNITLTYADFTGTVEIGIAPYVAETGDGTGTGDAGNTTGDADADVDTDADGNVTVTGDNNTTADVDDEKGLPTVGILPVVGVLAGLVAAVRRRR